MINRVKVSDNFSLHEFECRHCQTVKLDPELLQRLQALRAEVGRPVFITSAYRCPTHNRAVGGAVRSQHLTGKAADFTISGLSKAQRERLAEKHFGNGGIGYGGTFTHVDTGRRRRWNY